VLACWRPYLYSICCYTLSSRLLNQDPELHLICLYEVLSTNCLDTSVKLIAHEVTSYGNETGISTSEKLERIYLTQEPRPNMTSHPAKSSLANKIIAWSRQLLQLPETDQLPALQNSARNLVGPKTQVPNFRCRPGERTARFVDDCVRGSRPMWGTMLRPVMDNSWKSRKSRNFRNRQSPMMTIPVS
jgi:hypothetical protein